MIRSRISLRRASFVGVDLCGVGEGAARFVEVFVVEQFREPLVDLGEDCFFFDVDGGRVPVTVDGVVAMHLAAVVGLVVVPGAFHASAAPAAAHETRERVVTAFERRPMRCAALPVEGSLRLVPELVGDQRFVCLFFGVDPVVLVVPAHASVVTERDVVDVEEDLVAFLAVPDLIAEIPGILEDRSDRGVSPAGSVLRAVRVTAGVAGAGGEDSLGGEHRRDGVESFAGDELGEDPPHDGCGHGVGLEAMEPTAVVRLAQIWVRAGIGEAVAERWSAALEASFDRHLSFHRGSDAGLDAVPFAFAHAAVERHDDLVGVATGIDRSTDLGHPQLDAVVHEDREREPELVAIERALRFADHDRVEPAVMIGECLEETRGFGSPRPRQRS